MYYTLLAPNHLTWFLANTFVKEYESVQGAFKNHYIVICNTLYFTMLVKSSLLYFATNCFMCAIVFLFLLCVCVFLVLCQPPRVGADHHWCRWHLPRHPSNLRRPHIQDMPLIQHLPDRTMFVKVSIINRPNIQTVRLVDEIRISDQKGDYVLWPKWIWGRVPNFLYNTLFAFVILYWVYASNGTI